MYTVTWTVEAQLENIKWLVALSFDQGTQLHYLCE